MLEQNYRSTQTILEIADSIIKNNSQRKEKKLWTANEGGEKIFYYQAYDSDNEARFVSSKIDDHYRANPNYKLAILYRTNAQSRVFEEALRKHQNRIQHRRRFFVLRTRRGQRCHRLFENGFKSV